MDFLGIPLAIAITAKSVTRLAESNRYPFGFWVFHPKLEEGVGFEPTEPLSPAVFETAALVHYANPPFVEEGTGVEPETFSVRNV